MSVSSRSPHSDSGVRSPLLHYYSPTSLLCRSPEHSSPRSYIASPDLFLPAVSLVTRLILFPSSSCQSKVVASLSRCFHQTPTSSLNSRLGQYTLSAHPEVVGAPLPPLLSPPPPYHRRARQRPVPRALLFLSLPAAYGLSLSRHL